eukprot:TRINITY_DN6424_c1_g2_i1.p1 TRINITY_DN6424_c1_g2~~TRINITY_DN6424_c1_g2_i1.p1  ORF type:complete len:241 (-),score=77.46 TRINITY_DN6424_c1_g2_i1:287-1009(-)
MENTISILVNEVRMSNSNEEVANVVNKALNYEKLYVFGELLNEENVRELKNDEQYQPLYNLLEIFSYRTYSDYFENKDDLPGLSPEQEIKLKKLTVLTLFTKLKVIPYEMLQRELFIDSVRELEDLLIKCILERIIIGTIDQQDKSIDITFAIGRDICEGDLEWMQQQLKNWNKKSEFLLQKIEEQIHHAKSQFEAKKQEEDLFQKELETKEKNFKDNYQSVLQNNNLDIMTDDFSVPYN